MTPLYSPLALSWIYTVLFSLFVLVCFRVHGNFKFVGVLMRDLVEVRERHNMFDETVREKSLLVMLIVLTCLCSGILLQQWNGTTGGEEYLNLELPKGAAGAIIDSLLVFLYFAFEWAAYTVVGYVFSDRVHTWMWVRGFTAGMGFVGVFLFPLSLVALAYPMEGRTVAIIAFSVFVAVKLAFIFKGFRIFFTESSSWVVFLYYLCSLEIAPLIITIAVSREIAG